MQSLKTFLLDGLIQAALLLSLCGMRVQVGVEPDRSLSERGPTLALPPVIHTHLHNLRNSLEDGGPGLHPKSPDLDQFFTTRRLLGWVRELDRLEVPQTELETWLVQQDPAPLPVRLHSAPDRLIMPPQTWDVRENQHEWEGPDDEWEEPEEEAQNSPSQGDRAETPQSQSAPDLEEGDLTEEEHPEEDQSSESLQECLRLLESFPLTHHQQELMCEPSPESPSELALGPSDMEQQWQDVMDLMAPQSSDVDLLNFLEPTEAQVTTLAEQERPLLNGSLQHGLLLPLLPSDQLNDPSLSPAPRRLSDELPQAFLLDEQELEELLGDAQMLEDIGLLEEDLSHSLEQDGFSVDMSQHLEQDGFSVDMSQQLEQEGYLDPELTRRTSRLSLSSETHRKDDHSSLTDVADELDSDSGLSLDSIHCPPSPSDSEASSYSSSSSSSSSAPSPLPVGAAPMEVTIKEEPEDDDEQLGAVGGHYDPHQDSKQHFSPFYSEQKLFSSFPWFHQVTHDHNYNQPSHFSPKSSSRPLKSSPKHEKPYQTMSKHMWSRDERRAKALNLPFSNELIVNLPVDDFNDLLANYRLDEDQLNLIRDIRRRGKNKIAAQNCRKRKMDTLAGLEKDVSTLRRRRSRLLKERQEALRTLQELKQQMSTLYHDVFSALRDEHGRPLDVNEYTLSFERDGSVDVVSRRQSAKDCSRRKQKDHKK